MKMTVAKELIISQPEDKLLIAHELFLQIRGRVTKEAYAKTLSRMVNYGVLRRLGKGVYYRPQKTRFGQLPISNKEVESYYMSNNKGMLIGYKMYNRHGLTTQVAKRTEILTTMATSKTQKLNNDFFIVKAKTLLTPKVRHAIEMLEIMQHARQIEDLNTNMLGRYVERFAKSYDNETMEQILHLPNHGYKKSTIASIASILDFWKVPHTLSRHISKKSRYTSMMAEEIYATA
ncbi:hypothetical protein FZ041_04235 [Selenomonas caprae]|uniref:Uncharacterized protein n=1 Tax=Selenomonas caprae TaxID=2606905 RepID=A0A5D6WPN9_9FIRM|nr:DUF6088 family protein [Selenomonas caprae]TYZ29800.1 hypothetical protein FZ041_04235 [Selenomonas caprae]